VKPIGELLEELADNLRDDYWRAEHQQELLIVACILVALIEIPLAYLKARAYSKGLKA
jgi:hypothetical protein